MDPILLYLYRIPNWMADGDILELESVLKEMIYGIRRLDLEDGGIECISLRERTFIINTSAVIIKVEGLKERALRKGVGAWEINKLKTEIEEEVKSRIKDYKARCIVV
jgi:hypothetical protein